MSINHGRIYIFMNHEFLNRSDIMPRFLKMHGESMPHALLLAS